MRAWFCTQSYVLPTGRINTALIKPTFTTRTLNRPAHAAQVAALRTTSTQGFTKLMVLAKMHMCTVQ